MGTGCGVNGILTARAGADMLALDVNPEAVRAARDNARRNGVADRLEVRLSDIFDAVDPASDGPFDVVVVDPPSAGFSRAICSRWRRQTPATGRSPGLCARYGRTCQVADGSWCFSAAPATSAICNDWSPRRGLEPRCLPARCW